MLTKQTLIIALCFILIGKTNILHAQDLKPVLTYATAKKIVAGAIAYADSNKLGMAVAVYDKAGQLLAFGKMDDASAAVGKIAIWKGLSAATYGYSTAETAKWNMANAPDMATAAGGLVIKTSSGINIGGVGVSGAPSEVDIKCAEAGLRAAGLL